MFELENGRKHFYQWDAEQRLIVKDNTIQEAHFCNRTDDCSLTCGTYKENGIRYVNVPNILLQDNWDIRVYGYCDNYTKVEKRFEVIKRSKPTEYTYTETEVKTYTMLESRIEALENHQETTGVSTVNGKAGTVVLTAEDIGALPDDTIIPVVPTKVSAFENDSGYLMPNSLAAYYTKEETKTAIDTAIDAIPPTDLSNYYTKSQTNTAINNAKPDLSPYATKVDIVDMATKTELANYYTKEQTNTQINAAKPDLSPYAKKMELEGLATETYVSNSIAAIPPTDLSNYYTMAQTNSKITTSLSGYAKEEYVNTKIADLIGTAPETLDTLGEIATALEDNTSVIDTLNQAIGTKADKSDLNGLATETYVKNSIAAIPETDLSNYYTKAQVNTAISNAKPDLTPYAKTADFVNYYTIDETESEIDRQISANNGNYYTKAQTTSQITTALSPYAKKTELPSIVGLATETYVDNAIAAIPDTDLSNYYTKAQTNTQINNAKPDLTPYATKANSETWTFTLKDGTTLTKKVVLA